MRINLRSSRLHFLAVALGVLCLLMPGNALAQNAAAGLEEPGVVVTVDGGDHAEAIGHFFSQIKRATDEQDTELMSRLYPMRLLLERNAEPMGLTEEMLELFTPQLPQLQQRIAELFVNPIVGVGFEELDIRSVRAHPDGTLVVFTRQRSIDGVVTRMRWWLCDSDDGLVAYDMESVDMGMRMSVGILVGVQAAQEQDQDKRLEMLKLVQLIQLFSAGMFDQAIDLLEMIDGDRLDGMLQQFYYYVAGSFEAQMGEDYEAAIEMLTLALGENEALPAAYYDLAVAYNGMGEYEMAMECAERYSVLLDRDADICCEQGYALAMLGHNEEAAECYRAGLEDDPQSGYNVAGLGAILGDDDVNEFYDAFAELDEHELWFDELGYFAWFTEDVPLLKRLIEALRRVDSESEMLDQGRDWLDELDG